MTTLDLGALPARVGQEVGVSEWFDVTQDRIAQFAEATEDRQWIHVDAARAASASPFKATIAHGFLTLSLVSVMLRNTIAIGGVRMAINYGLNRVRFVAPVVSGSRVRGRFAIGAVEQMGAGAQVTWTITVEREREQKPACVAEWLVRYYTEI
jgi:acyl dehydratase